MLQWSRRLPASRLTLDDGSWIDIDITATPQLDQSAMAFRDRMIALYSSVVILVAVTGFTWSVMAAGPFDGVYVGSQTVTINNGAGNCLPADHVEVSVVDNTLSVKLGQFPLSADVSSDGSFNASKPQFGSTSPVKVIGKITGNRAELDMGGQRCNVHVSAIKQTSADTAPASPSTRLPFDQCMIKCQQFTSRTKEQCFDSCK